MFTTERTIIRPAFGMTLDGVIEKIKEQTNYNQHILYDHTGFYEPHHLINSNPHPNAIKILEQNPGYICSASLNRNHSEEGIYFRKKQKLDNYVEYLCDCKFNTIDTYLQDIKFKYECNTFLHLSSNPYAISFLLKNMDKIRWNQFCANPAEEAIDLLEQFPEKIDYDWLASNPNPRAIAIIRENIEKLGSIAWNSLCRNPCNEAVSLLAEHPDKINGWCLSENENPMAIELLKQFPEKIAWYALSGNSCKNAVELLEKNVDKIVWCALCLLAKTKRQFDLIRAYIHIITHSWKALCKNPHEQAVKILEEHPHKVLWYLSLKHQNVFETITTYNYAGIRAARYELHSEFHAWAGHPIRMVTKWRDWGFDNYGVDEPDESDKSV